MPRLFEQVENNNPNLLQRLGFGRAGNITENITFTNLLVWLNANLTFPSAGLNQSVVDIGDWNMNQSVAGLGSIAVAHGLDVTKIRRISTMIRNDDGTFSVPIDSVTTGVVADQNGGIVSISATNVNLTARSGGGFDNTGYDSTGYNRGWLVIDYVD